jgi:hypothetical protein
MRSEVSEAVKFNIVAFSLRTLCNYIFRSSILNTDAVGSFEKLTTHKPTQCHNPDNLNHKYHYNDKRIHFLI